MKILFIRNTKTGNIIHIPVEDEILPERILKTLEDFHVKQGSVNVSKYELIMELPV